MNVFVCEVTGVLGHECRDTVLPDPMHKVCIVCGHSRLSARERVPCLPYICGCVFICGGPCTGPFSCTEDREGDEVPRRVRAREQEVQCQAPSLEETQCDRAEVWFFSEPECGHPLSPPPTSQLY